MKNKIATRLEAAEAINLALGDISYPKSSANPMTNIGAADKIKSVSCSASSQDTESGIKPNDSSGINTSIAM